jgi:hypothetical protein
MEPHLFERVSANVIVTLATVRSTGLQQSDLALPSHAHPRAGMGGNRSSESRALVYGVRGNEIRIPDVSSYARRDGRKPEGVVQTRPRVLVGSTARMAFTAICTPLKARVAVGMMLRTFAQQHDGLDTCYEPCSSSIESAELEQCVPLMCPSCAPTGNHRRPEKPLQIKGLSQLRPPRGDPAPARHVDDEKLRQQASRANATLAIRLRTLLNDACTLALHLDERALGVSAAMPMPSSVAESQMGPSRSCRSRCGVVSKRGRPEARRAGKRAGAQPQDVVPARPPRIGVSAYGVTLTVILAL